LLSISKKGFPAFFIILLFLFIGGLILLVLGLIGEYMGRTFISMNKQPQYVVKERMNTQDKNKK
jgi:undecaprenyl-phosphate 4-deoxy-4-formamido-L-arabinose transferase